LAALVADKEISLRLVRRRANATNAEQSKSKRMNIISLIIEAVSGAVGGNIAGAAMKENSLGTAGNVYKDEKAGVAYIGREAEYQRYQQLAIQQQIAQNQIMAAEMEQQAALDWYGGFGFRRIWW
jgi:hypothetical protein